jgi:hypothetical protein
MALIAWHDGPAVTENLNLRTTWLYYNPDDPANAGVKLDTPPTVILHIEVIVLKPVDADLQVLAKRLQEVGQRVAASEVTKAGFNAAVVRGFPVIIDGV